MCYIDALHRRDISPCAVSTEKPSSPKAKKRKHSEEAETSETCLTKEDNAKVHAPALSAFYVHIE